MSRHQQKFSPALLDLLAAKGVRVSRPRLEVARALFGDDLDKASWHFTAHELHEYLSARAVQIAFASVYNILNTFAAHKLVSTLLFRDPKSAAQTAVYDTKTSDHFHVINEKTGEITDLLREGIHIEGLPENIRQQNARIELVIHITE